MFWKKIPNPFTKIATYDEFDFKTQPFISLQPHLIIQNYLLEACKFPNINTQVIMFGDRGTGKTSSLYWFKQQIEKNNNGNLIIDFHRALTTTKQKSEELRNTFTEKGSFIAHLNENFQHNQPLKQSFNLEEQYSRLDNFFGSRKYFLLIDFPDGIQYKLIENFLDVIEMIIGSRSVSIIIAINKPYLKTMDDISHIYGKFERKELRSFTLQQLKTLIFERIRHTAKQNNIVINLENEFNFTEEAIELIRKKTNGNPRNCLKACKEIFEYAKLNNTVKVIDVNIVDIILKEDYVASILNEKITDPTKKQSYQDLYNLIKEMKGKVVGEHKLIDKCKVKGFNWSMLTIRTRLRDLQKWELIDIRKDSENENINVISLTGD